MTKGVTVSEKMRREELDSASGVECQKGQDSSGRFLFAVGFVKTKMES